MRNCSGELTPSSLAFAKTVFFWVSVATTCSLLAFGVSGLEVAPQL
jgi:hypothetical protein